jgi:phosphopantothenoylcysteine decarboxylase/phosphopantothenate--cysteine ligase
MKVLIAISGGIAAYKVASIINIFKGCDHTVHVVMTDNATKFITPTVVGVLANKFIVENVHDISHIEEAQSCDIFLTVPATANIIGKYYHGIADDLVSTINLAIPKNTIKIICPAMNTEMYNNPIVQSNINGLISYGYHIIGATEGLLACGVIGIGKLPDPEYIVSKSLEIYNNSKQWVWPLNSKKRIATNDSYSFLDYLDENRQIDLSKVCDIPIYPHVGSLGVRRRHDHHKGVDLYAPDGAIVKAVEDGEILEICAFTGPSAGYPWWNDTQAIYARGNSGIVVYGEIEVFKDLEVGNIIKAGDSIGLVRTVIKHDKGRPMSMLHLALHDKDTLHNGDWLIGESKPKGLLDPTQYLINSKEI